MTLVPPGRPARPFCYLERLRVPLPGAFLNLRRRRMADRAAELMNEYQRRLADILERGVPESRRRMIIQLWILFRDRTEELLYGPVADQTRTVVRAVTLLILRDVRFDESVARLSIRPGETPDMPAPAEKKSGRKFRFDT